MRYERLAGGPDEASRGKGVKVALRLIDEPDFQHEGMIDFVDNVIDRASGTIRGRAQIPNLKGLFTPGMFARVKVPASLPYDALLVPDAAIASEQVRKYVMVLGPENTATQKYVTLGQLVDGKLRVIKDGLSPDDKVIVNGIARVRPGQAVNPQTEEQAKQAAQPPANAPAPAK